MHETARIVAASHLLRTCGAAGVHDGAVVTRLDAMHTHPTLCLKQQGSLLHFISCVPIVPLVYMKVQ
jgi:hypothetical protein